MDSHASPKFSDPQQLALGERQPLVDLVEQVDVRAAPRPYLGGHEVRTGLFTDGCAYFYACADEVAARQLQGCFGGWLAKRQTSIKCDGRLWLEFHEGWKTLPQYVTENWLVCAAGTGS